MTSKELRRAIHRNPELSFEEYATQQLIIEALEAEGISCRKIATTGVLAKIEGQRGNHKRAVVLRADIDALPITELNDIDYCSERKGVMHACGHDMHTAILFGVLQSMNRTRDFEGTLFGLFQPGEELNPGGAVKVLEERPFDDYDVAAVIGEHVDATLEVGEVGICPGQFMASNDELRIYISGRGGHAARRADIDDTVSAIADMVVRTTSLNGPDAVVSVGKIVAEGATNVIPAEAYAEGTMRTFDREERERIYALLDANARAVEERYGVALRVDISRGYPSVTNDVMLAYEAMIVASDEGIVVREMGRIPMAEDFGYYTERYPALFYRLGVGAESGGSHT
ncbi:MAG: M20 family metallopeptidase, partial [Alistipes sp.]|nr:M20 family metallopeptidase [Alistipes sp.]